jgi:predicted deacylase
METPFWQDLPSGKHQRRCIVDGDLGFEVFIWRGENADEKVLLINGATHGDEWEGPIALTEWANTWHPNHLRGTVVMVPVLNEAAFFACRRESPLDGGNLARVFPGDPQGTPTQRIAHVFETQFIAHAGYYADFHSAGATYEIWPWAGYVMTEDEAILETQRRMASCFPSTWHWGSAYLPGRTISAACEHNVPAIYLECQGKGGVDEGDLEILRAGIDNLTKHLGFIDGETELHEPDGVRESSGGEEGHLQVENPAPCDGILTQIMPVGARIEKGELLATVQPLDGSSPQEVHSPKTGRIVMTRRFRAVTKDDALAAVVEI